MNLKEKILSISNSVRQLDRDNSDIRLPQNVYYLNENDIVCFEREHGEARYPYDQDGLVVWARSSGHIEAQESMFGIFKTILHHDEPNVAFYTGLPMGKEEFFPVSVLGVGRQLYEPVSVLRYVVYSFRCAYYVAETEDFISATRMHVDANKHIYFTYITVNKTQQKKKLYMAGYMEPWLSNQSTETFFARMDRFGEYGNQSYLICNRKDYLVCNLTVTGTVANAEYHSSGRSRFLGNAGRQVANATVLRTGRIEDQVQKVNTSDLPVCADVFHFEIDGDDYARIDYDLSYYHNEQDAKKYFPTNIDIASIDAELELQEQEELAGLQRMKIQFHDWNQNVNVHVLNKFLKNVQKQIKLCALGKNYAGPYLGVRDVMQQLESCLIWQPEECRRQFVVAMNYILEDGRPPRQFSVPETDDTIPGMDLRQFIDQGNWIISTLYTYLSYTDDYSILGEICGYYIAIDNQNHLVEKSEISDTVLDHIIKIMDYLVSKIDTEYTNCLRALYGDWNDALNGLGRTQVEGQEFGTGVSVMASLHFYQNCTEICEILSRVGGYEAKIATYRTCQDKIKEGLFKYAVDINEHGEKRILHGWGDKNSFQIGSWNDLDGVARTSSTANSFWALSGMIRNDLSYKEILLAAFDRLDSQYGFLTFDTPFPKTMENYVGRISRITPGTYENCASYVHSSTFAIMALFILGESERAWKELEKSIVISHDNCTMTPFVMPNSYCYNEEYSMDGVSMGDWYTGSGTVVIKGIVKYGFGVAPDLNGVTIQTARSLPCSQASLDIMLKGYRIHLQYKKNSGSHRKIYVNGNLHSVEYDDLMQTYKAYIPTDKLFDGMVIKVVDE